VPTVPPLKKRFGHDWWYDKDKDAIKDGIFSDHVCDTILECMVEGLPSNMGPGAVNHYRHSMIHCPVDIEVYDAQTGEKLGWTVGQEVYLDSDKIFIYVNGDEKNVAAMEETAYTVKIVGTGEGVMTYTEMILDGEGTVLEETVFENVAVEEGKIFEAGLIEEEGSDSELSAQLKVVDDEGKVLAQVKEDGSEVRASLIGRLFSGLSGGNGLLLILLSGALVLAVVLLVVIILLYKRSQKK